jgi:hypothetical protein
MGAVVCRDWGLGFPERDWGARFCLCERFFCFFRQIKPWPTVRRKWVRSHLRKWIGHGPTRQMQVGCPVDASGKRLRPLTIGPRELGPTRH